MPDGLITAQDPLGFGRLAAQNLANRQLDIQEREALGRQQLRDLQIGQAQATEQSRLTSLARQQQLQQGLSQALANIPEGENRFTVAHSFFQSGGFQDEANQLIQTQLDQLGQIEEIDPAAADKRFNQTVGMVQGLTARTSFDDSGKILNLTNTATGDVQSFRETPGTEATEDSPPGLTLIKGFVKGGAPTPDIFKNETTLRKEFVAQSGEFVKSRDAIGRVREAGKDPSPAGDLALIFNFMKVLDPGSVVRESEFRTAANAKAFLNQQEELGKEIPNFVQQGINRLLTGNKLLDPQRKDFLDRAERLFQPSKRSHAKRVGQFRGLAKRNQLDVRNIVLDITGEEEAEVLAEAESQAPAAPESTAGFKVIGVR